MLVPDLLRLYLVLAEKHAAALEGRPSRTTGSTRHRRNVAMHDFAEDLPPGRNKHHRFAPSLHEDEQRVDKVAGASTLTEESINAKLAEVSALMEAPFAQIIEARLCEHPEAFRTQIGRDFVHTKFRDEFNLLSHRVEERVNKLTSHIEGLVEEFGRLTSRVDRHIEVEAERVESRLRVMEDLTRQLGAVSSAVVRRRRRDVAASESDADSSSSVARGSADEHRASSPDTRSGSKSEASSSDSRESEAAPKAKRAAQTCSAAVASASSSSSLRGGGSQSGSAVAPAWAHVSKLCRVRAARPCIDA